MHILALTVLVTVDFAAVVAIDRLHSMSRSITDKVHTHSFNGCSTYVKLKCIDTYATDCNNYLKLLCMQYQSEIVNSALWGQTAGSA